MALDLQGLEQQLFTDMVFDLPPNTDQAIIDVIEACAKRNALTIYNFVKSGSVTIDSETANIE